MRWRRSFIKLGLIIMFTAFFIVPARIASAADEAKTLIYDDAGLLGSQEYEELSAMARKYGAQRETDFIIITTNNPDNIDIEIWVEDFYDEYAPGYDKPHGNAAILALDMGREVGDRDVYLAGFYKGEEYLDGNRLDSIRSKILPDLSNGDYKKAFETYIITAHKYMGFEPGINPDNPLFNLWVQLGGAVVIGGLAVGIMAYRSGGRVTVNRRTYEDRSTSGIVDQQDRYIRTTTTKRKIPKNNGGSSSGGGGVTRGGHSHSSSRGKF